MNSEISQPSRHSTLLSILSSVYSPQYTLLSILSSLYSPHYTLPTILSSLYSPHYTLLTILSSVYSPLLTTRLLLSTTRSSPPTTHRSPQVIGPGDTLYLPAWWWHQFEQPFEDTGSLNLWMREPPVRQLESSWHGVGGSLPDHDTICEP